MKWHVDYKEYGVKTASLGNCKHTNGKLLMKQQVDKMLIDEKPN
jgi:hypothetical protein